MGGGCCLLPSIDEPLRGGVGARSICLLAAGGAAMISRYRLIFQQCDWKKYPKIRLENA